jgi:predicted nucleic acid-binding protein
MHLIVDANVINLLANGEDLNFRPILDALQPKKAAHSAPKLVYCRHLQQEYDRASAKALALFKALDQQGRTKFIRTELVDRDMAWLAEHGNLRSNDTHIVALARQSGARLLCTNDRLLIEDFTNRHLVDNPRGNVYTTLDHVQTPAAYRRLIRRHCA